MRKGFVIIILFVVAIICGIWSPWNNWDLSFSRIFGVEPPAEIGGLQISSLAGELKVYIDGETRDDWTSNASDEFPLVIPAIEPGDHQVKLERTSSVSDAYWVFNQIINFPSGLDVVIAYELGPTQDFSGGHIIYASEDHSATDGVQLNVTSALEDVEVSIDGLDIGTVPIVGRNLSLDTQHTLVVSKSGYESQEFTLLPAEQVDRAKLQGYDLNVIVSLFLQPISVY